jgi:non-ribosomal peptide synthetase-like protein
MRAPRPVTPATTRLTVVPAAAPAQAAGAASQMAAVLAEVLKVRMVGVDSHFFDELGADSMLMARFCAKLRKRPDLPAVSIKDVYRHPTISSLVTALAPAARPALRPSGAAEGMAAVLAEVLKVDKVSVDGHFFDDLGADSMLMARFCAKLRKRPDLPTVSIKDVYRHTTITALAALFGRATPGPRDDAAARPASTADAPALPDPATGKMSRSRPHFFLCGLLQAVWILAFPVVLTFVAANGFAWVSTSPTLQELGLRSLVYGAAAFVVGSLLPVPLKWLLVGRWKPRQFRVWSFTYFRFWLVRTIIQLSPLVRFAGSPIFSMYLRLLGAKIGRGVVILTPTVPACPDMLSVGAGSIIRKDAVITGYRAVDGVIQTGRVSLGRDVVVGEMTVLDIATAMGDGAQLGHSSSLHSGQSVPAGAHWHGSPAEPTTIDYRTVRNTKLSFLRRFLLPLFQLLFAAGVTMPLAIGLPVLVFQQVPQLATLVAPLPPAIYTWGFYRNALLVSTVFFFGLLLLRLLLMMIVPRLLRVLVRPDREYRLYGVRYWAHRRIGRMTNNRYFMQLFGDSSFVVGYLRSIGYKLKNVVQTGSNFGSAVQHDNPFLSTVGTGTVVADGLSIINADYSASHFRVSRVAIGAHNFLGNRVAYPAQGRTGDNCLLATKVMVPMDGKIREGVGLLGSPSFEIPRTVDRDHQLDVADPAQVRRLLRRKNRHNALTILMFLLSRWILTSAITILTLVAVDMHSELGLVVAGAGVAITPLTVGYLILVDRLVRRMMVHRPNGCSIYDRAFWRHERFWKLGADRFPQLFNGTPMKNVIWRLLGAKIGKRVFDDGCTFTERRFVSIGDRCTLNIGSIVQCHSQEDGAFKSDRSAVGAGTTLGVGAFVHYGVQIGPGVQLEADSFLMKGSEVPAGSRWGGNPAMEIESAPAAPPAPHDDRRAALAGYL